MIQISFVIHETKKVTDTAGNISKVYVPNKNGLVSVKIVVTFDGERERGNLFKIKPDDWSEKYSKVKANKKNMPYNDHNELNDYMNALEHRIKAFYYNKTSQGIAVTKSDIKQIIKSKIPASGEPFFDVWQRFIDESVLEKASGTIKAYGASKTFFENACSSRKITLDFNNVTPDLVDKLKLYCIENGYQDSYLAKNLKDFKTFCNWGIRNDIFPNRDLSFLKIKLQEKQVFSLTKSEFDKLANFAFENKKHEKVRDVFIFSCMTGLRISDLKFRPSDVDLEQSVLNLREKKTKHLDVIPLVDPAKKILKKYSGYKYDRALPVMADQYMNRILKECAEICGINSEITIEKIVNGKTISKSVKKSEVISIHWGRKTLSTLASGVLMPDQVKKITGHKSQKAYDRYINHQVDDLRVKLNELFV
ncbi:tyrosine-type recombinase/integrase [Saccharicrinis sp. FJH54]|uniref:tyrosine-type recombinase/integrase n=1 Tax=Saccharicrinis sp. FJH54 TaxID=3344665 RepID=UPI0035D3ED49